jgi:pimeloyl-ACP methyl ester carboxylesterase
MAMDTRELMDIIGWDSFHVVGLSMGGMIAQELVFLCQRRVLSLTLESTYAYFNGLPNQAYTQMVVGGPKEKTLEAFASHVVNNLLFPKVLNLFSCQDVISDNDVYKNEGMALTACPARMQI